jgi:hypothetical protein
MRRCSAVEKRVVMRRLRSGGACFFDADFLAASAGFASTVPASICRKAGCLFERDAVLAVAARFGAVAPPAARFTCPPI